MITPLTEEQKQALWDKEEAYQEMENTMRSCWCAECGGPLTIATNPKEGSDALYCAANHHHQGFTKKKSLWELHKAGVEIPYASDYFRGIEAKRRRKK